ncbi:MAG: DinB family protein [Bacteroidota bacterium]
MQKHLDLMRITRRNLIGIAQSFSLDQLNEIPAPLRNNIVWNVAHVVVTQQLLCYGLAGLKLNVDIEMVEKYRKGSRPEASVGPEEWEHIQGLMVSLVDQTEQDLAEGRFQELRSYSTSYGVTLNTIEDAFAFNNLHESMHLGTVIAMRRLLR